MEKEVDVETMNFEDLLTDSFIFSVNSIEFLIDLSVLMENLRNMGILLPELVERTYEEPLFSS